MSNTQRSILVVDDDAGITSLLTEVLRDEGHTVHGVLTAADALAAVEQQPFDLMITDLVLPDLRGNALLQRVKKIQPSLPVILITAFGSMELAIQVLREGASDFIAKPFTPDQLLLSVHRVWMQHELARTDTGRSERADAEKTNYLSVPPPRSAAMQRVEALARRAASTDAHVLITGESGTGKTRLAHQMHQHSARAEGPFVVLNCGAIPSALIESELFGSVKGAFTDAKRDRVGLLESADGGTLFLDEIADLPAEAQAKMLRVLERKLIRPVGATQERAVDIRVMSATHQSLEQAVAEGRFRADLYYRLHVIKLELPPLRQRTEDLADIAEALLQDIADDASSYTLDDDALQWMQQWSWPGNIRELSNRLQRAVALGQGDVITRADLRAGELEGVQDAHASLGVEGPGPRQSEAWAPRSLAEVEREHIERTLAHTGGNKAQAAALLQIDRRTLYRRLAADGTHSDRDKNSDRDKK